MKWPADYHMHTPLCRHATGEPGDYAARAVAIGLTEIGFSDHSPMPRDDFDNWRMYADQLDEYVAKVRQAQKDFPNLTIRLALEVDYLPGYEDWIRELAARHPWDYFIGSVHYVSDSWAIDNPQKLSEWKNRDAFEVWSAYFDRLTKAAETGFFEIIGHADLPKKFGHRPPTGLHAALRKIPECGKETQLRHRTQHRRFAEGLPGNLSQPPDSRARVSKRRADHVWLGRPRAGGSGDEFCRSHPARARRWLPGKLPVRAAETSNG